MKLAVFDIDGTLIHENRVEDACFLGALQAVFGFDHVDADWTQYADVTDAGLLHQVCKQRWGRPANLVELRQFRDAYTQALIEKLEPGDGEAIAGAARFLDRLRGNQDWRVAIATGNFLRLALHKLRRAGIAGSDLPIATADDASRRSDLVRLAVSRAQEAYGVSAFQHVVSVGDAPWDLRTARELQMPFVAVGERCGAPSSGSVIISDYTDGEGVLRHMSAAVCW